MKKFLILAFVLFGVFSFGANSNGSHVTEPEQVEFNYSTSLIEIHIQGTLTTGPCVIHYDIWLNYDVSGLELLDGCVTMGEGCINSGTFDLRGTGEVENGYITELDTFSENEYLSSNEFSEALRADLNKKLN